MKCWRRCVGGETATQVGIRPGMVSTIATLAAEKRLSCVSHRQLDLTQLWGRRGVVVIPEELGTDAGMLWVGDRVTTIYVNQDELPVRQRFTIAHEYFHLAQHVPEFGREAPADTWTNAQLEREANRFAVELLMPEGDVIKAWRDCRRLPDGQRVWAAANMLGVSTQAMRARLRQFGSLAA